MGSSPPTPASIPSDLSAAGRLPAWSALLLALAACLPVLVARYPQMSDYPAHLARYYVMLDAGRSPALAHWYGFRWEWSGNVGVDLLIRPFAAVFGVEQGGRVIVGLIPPLTGLGILAVEHSLRGRVTASGLMALAFIWSPMMLIGLLNFTLGLALALLAFALWIRLDGRVWRAAPFVPIGLAVWLCHMSAWGVLGVLVFGYEWQRRGLRRALPAPWPLLAPLVPMLLGHGAATGLSYGPVAWAYKIAIWERAMRDSVSALDIASLVLVLALLAAALALRRIDWRLGIAALILLALSLVLPRHVSGGDYVDFRMIPTGLMIGCLAIDWRWPRWATAVVPLLYAGRLAVTTLGWHADSAATARLLQALDHVPVGADVASAVAIPSDAWRLDHFEHIGCYAVLRRDALVNSNFALPHVHMLHLVRGGYADPSHRVRQPAAEPVDLTRFAPATGAGFLWYVGVSAPIALPPGAQVIWRSPPGTAWGTGAGGRYGLLARLANSSSRD